MKIAIFHRNTTHFSYYFFWKEPARGNTLKNIYIRYIASPSVILKSQRGKQNPQTNRAVTDTVAQAAQKGIKNEEAGSYVWTERDSDHGGLCEEGE